MLNQRGPADLKEGFQAMGMSPKLHTSCYSTACTLCLGFVLCLEIESYWDSRDRGFRAVWVLDAPGSIAKRRREAGKRCLWDMGTEELTGRTRLFDLVLERD